MNKPVEREWTEITQFGRPRLEEKKKKQNKKEECFERSTTITNQMEE